MNPYLNYPYVPQHIEPKIISYTVDSAMSKACYYDTQRGADSEKKY